MDRLRAIADAHYRAGPPSVKALAFDFFKAMDTDGDGKVSLSEFLVFMTVHEGQTRLNDPHFFRDLDMDKDGYLDFWEVLTLYYIIKSGRPLCDSCGVLVTGTFFSCVECFNHCSGGGGGGGSSSSSSSSYSLCIYCYRSKRSCHNHDGRQQFLDTFTLLQQTKKNAPRTTSTTVNAILLSPNHHESPSWTPQISNAIVPHTQINRWGAALATLELAISIGSITTTMCTIL